MPEMQCLRHVRLLDLTSPIQIRNRLGHSQTAVHRSGRQTMGLGECQQMLVGDWRDRQALQLAWAERMVGNALALHGDMVGSLTTLAYLIAALGQRRQVQLRRRQRHHLHTQVDAVKQRAA